MIDGKLDNINFIGKGSTYLHLSHLILDDQV